MSPLGESVAGAEAQGRIGASLGPSITARRPGGVGAETGTGDLILRALDFQQQKRPDLDLDVASTTTAS